jgi:hypothetical protein
MTRWTLGLTAFLVSAALPAMAADWNHIGSVTFGERFDRQSQFTRFDGVTRTVASVSVPRAKPC